MKQILIFNDTLQPGGTETLLTNILIHLSKKKCKVTLLLPYPTSKNILIEKIPANIHIEYLYQNQLSRWRKVFYENLMSFFPRLYAKTINLDLKKYDLIVSFKDSVYSIIFSRAKQKKILWIHNLPSKAKYNYHSFKDYLPITLLRIRVKRLIRSFKKFDEVIFVSNISLKKYIEVFNNGKITSKQHLRVLYNAIDFPEILKLSRQNGNNATNSTSTTFIMVTRLSTEKRIDRVIKAAKKLKSEGYDFHINIFGEGPLQKEMESLISFYSLNDTVNLKGYTGNPYPYIKESDWLISSSEKESFSLVLLESILLGTPVITTDCGGPAEIVCNGEFGLLTENNSTGIYEGMKKVLKNPELSLTYKKKADKCLKRFDYNEWLLSVEEIFGVK